MKQKLYAPLSIKAVDIDDDQPNIGRFTGYANVYENLDLNGDIVKPGAFARTLKEDGTHRTLLWQHDMRMPIGEVKLADSPQGLYVEEGRINLNTQAGREAYHLMKDTPHAIRSMSIGYGIHDGGAEQAKDSSAVHLTSLDLMEVSLVTFPANEAAVVTAVKTLAEDADADSIDTQTLMRAAANLEQIINKKTANADAAQDDPDEDAGTANDDDELAKWKTLISHITGE